MKKRIFAGILIVSFMVVLTLGISFAEEITFPKEEDHPHKYTHTQSIGDYHASFYINHQKGEISVLITDKYEDPVILRAKRLKAEIISPSGEVKKVKFVPARHAAGPMRMGPRSGRHMYSSRYGLKRDWIENIHEFKLVVEIPIKGKIYEAGFNYKTSPREHMHHKHK
ncbi:MAG: hypothetical protein ACE5JK_02195 [Candidatus Omnitrophota bacterium]